MKRLVIVTDERIDTNISGVATWLFYTKPILERHDFAVTLIHPGQFQSIPLPTYPEISISLLTRKKMEDMLESAKPDYIHLVTEGSLGLVARMACMHKKWKFTTAFHTRFPEYVKVRLKSFQGLTYSYIKWFHNAGACTMVTTASLLQELTKKGFKNLAVSPLGVDMNEFKKDIHAKLPTKFKKPIFVYVGRIAPEKNLEAFLECDLPGTKLLVGDGPSKSKLEATYRKNTVFAGYKTRHEMVQLLSVSDVFVFPSKTDTFGLTIIEALACGLPVAAFDVQGPNDIIENGKDGFLGDNLEANAKKCLAIGPKPCIEKARRYSWENSAETFIENLVGIAT